MPHGELTAKIWLDSIEKPKRRIDLKFAVTDGATDGHTDRVNDKKQAVVLKHTTNPVPVLHITASRGFSELTKNVLRWSHGHSTPSLKISCKSVQPFSRNLANKETKKERKKQRYKQRNRSKTIQVPGSIGDVVTTQTRQ